MRLAIFENVTLPNSYESKLNKMLVDEFTKLGYDVLIYVPSNYGNEISSELTAITINEAMPVESNQKNIISKVFSIGDDWKRHKVYKYLYVEMMQKKIDALCIYVSDYKRLRSISNSLLLRSPVPLILIFNQVERKNTIKFIAEARRFNNYNVKIVVLSFARELMEKRLENMFLLTAETIQSDGERHENIQAVSNDKFVKYLEKIIYDIK